MITGKIENWKEVINPTPLVEKAIAWVEEHKDGNVEAGRHIVDGDNLFVDVNKYTTFSVADGVFEAHRKYIDLQFMIKGKEQMFQTSVDGLKVHTEYNPEKDAILFEQPEERTLECQVVSAGEFAVFGPEDAHMPGRHPENDNPVDVIKFVAKVKIS